MTSRALQEATLLVLTALSRGSQHGPGIITEVAEISGDRVRLRAGTLYTVLDRLRADGLIGVDREEVVASRLRRYYRLTPMAGRPPAVEAATRHHPAPGPDLRIGDADRDAAVAALREHFAHGRLTLEELTGRLDAALTATRQSEIARITTDLPRPCWLTFLRWTERELSHDLFGNSHG
jgi:Domain of unknown function (DUF1707)/Transcriptional regulator PadR-like family